MNTSVISINQLTRCFKETVAIDDLSLEVQAGEIFGFLGHNGAGIGFVIGENLLLSNGVELAKYLPFWFGTRLTEIYQKIATIDVHSNYVQANAGLPVKLLPINQAVGGIAIWTAVLLGLALVVFFRQDLPE